MRPRVFFDTQIYSDPRIDEKEFRKRLHLSNFRIDLSSITLFELLDGVARSRNEEDFQRAQIPLKIAWSLGGKNILPFPGRFALENVFRVRDRKYKFETDDFRLWHSVAIRAKTRGQLFSGNVPWPTGVSIRKFCGLNPDIISSQLDDGRALYIQQISDYITELVPDWEGRRGAGTRNLLTREKKRTLKAVLVSEKTRQEFVEGLFGRLGLTKEEVLQEMSMDDVALAFDALITHRKHILFQALTTPYDFERDSSAFHDFQQLYYIADRHYTFVTEDTGLRHAVAASHQAARVMRLADFLRLLPV